MTGPSARMRRIAPDSLYCGPIISIFFNGNDNDQKAGTRSSENHCISVPQTNHSLIW